MATSPLVRTQQNLSPSAAMRRACSSAALLCFVSLTLIWLNFNASWIGAVDQGWNKFSLDNRNDALTAIHSFASALTGGPIGGSAILLVPVVVALFKRRWWLALYFTAGGLLANTLLQVIKKLVGRQRPENPLVTVDVGSFPSGHVTGVAFLVVALSLIVVRAWTWILASLVVVFEITNRTYLSAHWFSDTIAGALLGSATALLLWAALSGRIARQNAQLSAAAK
ncbi:hypothetical protein DQ354_07475 [Arthrobacter sp. AQ5-06]|nr:hypothetical protein DQ354_07475 [Arthrobacter sp. AQ5-06]